MRCRWVVVAASAAVHMATNDGVGIEAFQLQSGSGAGLLGLGLSHRGRTTGPASPNTTPPVSAGCSRVLPASQLRFPAAFAQEEGGNLGEFDGSALAMASFLRCHKPLLNDRGPEIPDGNLCMLLRGCDAHQRMISPLELKTNADALPGAAAAGIMATRGPAAAEALCEQLKDKLSSNGRGPPGLCLVELLKLEVGKVHRLLQYATAAGLKKNFLSQDALLVMLELYEEAGLDSEYIINVLQGLRDFYKGEMDKANFTDFFLPAYEEVIAKFQETKKLVRPAEKLPVTSLPFEPTPDPRTLTPLVVDIMSFKDTIPNLKAWEGRQ